MPVFIHSLTSSRAMHVCGIARQQNPASMQCRFVSLSYNNIDWQQHVIDFAAGRSHSRENRRFRDYTSKWGLA